MRYLNAIALLLVIVGGLNWLLVGLAQFDLVAEHDQDPVALAQAMDGQPARHLTGALRHALAFSTWHSLTANGIGRSDAVTLATAIVDAAAAQLGRPQAAIDVRP